jgi:monoterpene epsilon-lactone hydrolase
LLRRSIRELMMSESPSQQTASWLTTHLLAAKDKVAMAGLRTVVEPLKGTLQGTAARPAFDAIIEHAPAPEGVTFEADTVGGIAGWWCRPRQVTVEGVILHLHGGWFNWGSARAYRHFVGHIAASAGACAFIPDYKLAPEHPFPAAVTDVTSCYDGLIQRGFTRIALVGDSAGGALALVLLRLVTEQKAAARVTLVGAVALSPVTDLTLSGQSWKTRAAADPYFIESQARELVGAYLNGADPTAPKASPLHGNLSGLPPIRVHVGDDEMLLDDSVRYVARAVDAGVDARVDVWQGMPHGFVSGVDNFTAANEAMAAIGAFLNERLTRTSAELS